MPEPVVLSTDILPSSRLREDKNIVITNGQKWIPIFCANCGKDGGLILEAEWDAVKAFAFYLCNACAERWSPLVDTMMAPDEVFWRKVREAQLEAFGRELTQPEIIAALQDENHILSKLAKERRG
ncbi:MAG TPA: hypothetical protein VND65_18150 [Candidatus Binatia bacterium]|nr:hypothetical protein [Candidatus Binatia bacterium]